MKNKKQQLPLNLNSLFPLDAKRKVIQKALSSVWGEKHDVYTVSPSLRTIPYDMRQELILFKDLVIIKLREKPPLQISALYKPAIPQTNTYSSSHCTPFDVLHRRCKAIMQNYTHQNNHQHVLNVLDWETLLFHFNYAGSTVIEITVAMQPHHQGSGGSLFLTWNSCVMGMFSTRTIPYCCIQTAVVKHQRLSRHLHSPYDLCH